MTKYCNWQHFSDLVNESIKRRDESLAELTAGKLTAEEIPKNDEELNQILDDVNDTNARAKAKAYVQMKGDADTLTRHLVTIQARVVGQKETQAVHKKEFSDKQRNAGKGRTKQLIKATEADWEWRFFKAKELKKLNDNLRDSEIARRVIEAEIKMKVDDIDITLNDADKAHMRKAQMNTLRKKLPAVLTKK
jgi:hypothetical protein